MLRVIDCQPGVEVIAIKNRDDYRPKLSIGHIYTIRFYSNVIWSISKQEILQIDNISLEEIMIADDGRDWGYGLDQFKLRDRNELIDLLLRTSLKDEGPLRKVREEV